MVEVDPANTTIACQCQALHARQPLFPSEKRQPSVTHVELDFHDTSPIPKDRNAEVLLWQIFSVQALREGCHLFLQDSAFTFLSEGRAPHSPLLQPASTAMTSWHGPRNWDQGSSLATWAFRPRGASTWIYQNIQQNTVAFQCFFSKSWKLWNLDQTDY